MSLARIEIEEHSPGQWVAHVEAGFPTCRNAELRGTSIVDIVSKVGDAYEQMMGRPAFAVVTPTADQIASLNHAWFSPASAEQSADHRASDDLIALAKRNGIPADRRWSRARIESELAKVPEKL